MIEHSGKWLRDVVFLKFIFIGILGGKIWKLCSTVKSLVRLKKISITRCQITSHIKFARIVHNTLSFSSTDQNRLLNNSQLMLGKTKNAPLKPILFQPLIPLQNRYIYILIKIKISFWVNSPNIPKLR